MTRQDPSVETKTEAELRQLSVRYAAAVDSGDCDEFAELFAEDGSLTVHRADDGHTLEGRDELRRIPALLARYERTFHFLGQHRYWEGCDGRVHGEVLCTANHLSGGINTVMYIRYLDDYDEAVDGRWRISSRGVQVQWTKSTESQMTRAVGSAKCQVAPQAANPPSTAISAPVT